MANPVSLLSGFDFFLSNQDTTFEQKVKRCINWKKGDWVSMGLDNSLFSTLISSLKYWNSQFEEALGPHNVILTLFSNVKEAYVDLDDVVDSIEALGSHITITGYNRFRNRKYISIELENESMKEEVLKNLKMVKDYNVVFLNWVSQTSIIEIKVQWLPKHFDVTKVRLFLENYVEVLDETRLSSTLKKGKNLLSGDLSFKCILLKGVLLSGIPYFCKFGKLEGMITIAGRESICLTCSKVGHLSFQCPTPYCKKCRELKPSKHVCEKRVTSYADKLKKSTTIPEVSHYHQWGDVVQDEELLVDNVVSHDTPLRPKDYVNNPVKKLFDSSSNQVNLNSSTHIGFNSGSTPDISEGVLSLSQDPLAVGKDHHLLKAPQDSSQNIQDLSSSVIQDIPSVKTDDSDVTLSPIESMEFTTIPVKRKYESVYSSRGGGGQQGGSNSKFYISKSANFNILQ